MEVIYTRPVILSSISQKEDLGNGLARWPLNPANLGAVFAQTNNLEMRRASNEKPDDSNQREDGWPSHHVHAAGAAAAGGGGLAQESGQYREKVSEIDVYVERQGVVECDIERLGRQGAVESEVES